MKNFYGIIPVCNHWLATTTALNTDLENAAAYIKGWAKCLSENPNWISYAPSCPLQIKIIYYNKLSKPTEICIENTPCLYLRDFRS